MKKAKVTYLNASIFVFEMIAGPSAIHGTWRGIKQLSEDDKFGLMPSGEVKDVNITFRGVKWSQCFCFLAGQSWGLAFLNSSVKNDISLLSNLSSLDRKSPLCKLADASTLSRASGTLRTKRKFSVKRLIECHISGRSVDGHHKSLLGRDSQETKSTKDNDQKSEIEWLRKELVKLKVKNSNLEGNFHLSTKRELTSKAAETNPQNHTQYLSDELSPIRLNPSSKQPEPNNHIRSSQLPHISSSAQPQSNIATYTHTHEISRLNGIIDSLRKEVAMYKEIKSTRESQFISVMHTMAEKQRLLDVANEEKMLLREKLEESKGICVRLAAENLVLAKKGVENLKDNGKNFEFETSWAKNIKLKSMLREKEKQSKTHEVVEYVRLREMLTEENIRREKLDEKIMPDVSAFELGTFTGYNLELEDTTAMHKGFSIPISPISKVNSSHIHLDMQTEVALRQVVSKLALSNRDIRPFPATNPLPIKQFLTYLLSIAQDHSSNKENIQPNINYTSLH